VPTIADTPYAIIPAEISPYGLGNRSPGMAPSQISDVRPRPFLQTGSLADSSQGPSLRLRSRASPWPLQPYLRPSPFPGNRIVPGLAPRFPLRTIPTVNPIGAAGVSPACVGGRAGIDETSLSPQTAVVRKTRSDGPQAALDTRWSPTNAAKQTTKAPGHSARALCPRVLVVTSWETA